ncbi:MAG: histidinol phosphate phosphatase domain-containing protein [Candidatus Methanosuratincola sp.]|nr:histidinol phosphate phosphatase domain-containing protein [Candidatus Methanosuratincola sp.]
MDRRICDFHMHSFYSDGDLLPSEIARRTRVLGNRLIAITDHADASNLEWVVNALRRASDEVSRHLDDFDLVPGVELTHVPPATIPELAREAKQLGAKIVIVHGETPVEPVEGGTNRAACRCADVDILAHPGLVTEEDVLNAKNNGVFLELSYRGGHCLGNGHVARLAMEVEALLLVNSDAHTVGDHLTPEMSLAVARGAGLSEADAEKVVFRNPEELIKRF